MRILLFFINYMKMHLCLYKIFVNIDDLKDANPFKYVVFKLISKWQDIRYKRKKSTKEKHCSPKKIV